MNLDELSSWNNDFSLKTRAIICFRMLFYHKGIKQKGMKKFCHILFRKSSAVQGTVQLHPCT